MSMERTAVLEMMGELKLYGMKSAYDETLATALKRKHEPQQLVADLLKAEISEKQARSIRYQLASAKLPLAKDVDDFAFEDTPINENLVRDLAGGAFIAQQRNVVLVGGTGTGKTHLAIAIARNCIRAGCRGRFFNTVDLVNRLETEGRSARQGRLADYLTRLDFVILDELGYLPALRAGRRTAAVPSDQPPLRAHLDHRHHQSGLRRMADRLWRSQDDDSLARPPHPSLRHRRDRQRKLALQAPRVRLPRPLR
jgi:DNA replication protein DnaC